MDSVLQLILSRKVNFLQVYNRLEVSRTYTSFTSFCMTAQTSIEKFSINSVKSLTHKKCFQSFMHFFKQFPSLFQDCAVFSTRFPRAVTCLQNPVRRNISELCLFWN